jgi:amino acid permease
LKERTTSYAIKTANLTLIFGSVTYGIVEVAIIFLYGSNTKGTFLSNFKEQNDWNGYIL